MESGAISGKMLKDLYDLCFPKKQDFPVIYEEAGRPQQSSDSSALEKIIDEMLAANPKQLEQFGGQDDGRRLFRRPGDESFEGPGQSPGYKWSC